MRSTWTALCAGACLTTCLAACSPAEAPERPAGEPALQVAAQQPAAAPVGGALQPRPLLSLRGEGLALVDPETGSMRPLAFGVDDPLVRRAVAAARGAPTGHGTNPRCRAGSLDFALFDGDLTLWFEHGKFVGWAVGLTGSPQLTTASGLGIGSTRKALESAYDAKVEGGPLGGRFEAGGLHGVLTGGGAEAKVTALWAGTACITGQGELRP